MTGEIEYAIEHFGSLTTREVDVFRLIAVGFTSKQAARWLSISHRTVETAMGDLVSTTVSHGKR